MTVLSRAAFAVAATLMLAGCYTSGTAILTADNSKPLPGVGEGVYCHAENRLVPPQVTVAPAISEALGENQCRDLRWDPDSARYVDALSGSMLFRTAPTETPALALLQVQTSETAVARYMPVAAVDGMFILYDPAGEWPADLIEASGLALLDDGSLARAPAPEVSALLEQVWEHVLDEFRADVAFVEDADGPRLEFKRVDTAYRYLVHFRKDWSGDAERMRGAMIALAGQLGLGQYDATWTDHAE
jgi:hypothetical protein